MAEPQIVGRIGVRIIPSTKGFRTKARNELREVEKSLPKLKVQATFDDTGLRRDIITKVSALNKEMKANDAYKVKIRARIVEEGMRGQIQSARKALNNIASEQGVVFKADAVAATVGVELDPASVAQLKANIEALRTGMSPQRVTFMPVMAKGRGAIVESALDRIARNREVEFKPSVNVRALASVGTALAAVTGLRIVGSVLAGLSKRIRVLDKDVPIIAAAAEAIGLLGAAGLAAGSNLFALASSLAQIGPAFLALPGILGGAIVAFGAMIAVLKDFNAVIPELATRLGELQDQMSQNFWAVAEQPIRNLIDNLFPAFAAGINETSTALGEMFAALANGFSSNLSGGVLGEMFANLNESIRIAATGAEAFTSVIATLGTVGTQYLPRLSQWFVDITTQFDNFLTAAANDGRLTGWIDNGIVQLKALGSVIASTFSTLSGIAEAASAAGGAGLVSLANTMERVAAVANSPAFQSVLTDTLRAAHDAMAAIGAGVGDTFGNAVEQIAVTLQNVFPIIGETFGQIGNALFSALSQVDLNNGIVAMFQGLQQGIQGLLPALGPVATALGVMAEKIGTLASIMGPVVGEALQIIAAAITALIPAIEPLIVMLGETMLTIVQAVGPPLVALFQQIASVFQSQVGPALMPVVEVLGNLAAAVLPMVINAISQLVPVIAPLVAKISELVQLIAPVLVPVLTFLAELLLDSVVGAISGVVQALTGFIDILIGVIEFFKAVFTGQWSEAWSALGKIVAGVADVIVGLFRALWYGGILKIAGLAFTLLKGLFKKAWKAIVNAVKNPLKTIWKLIKGTFKVITAIIKGALKVAQKIVRGAWKYISKRFSGAGKKIVSTVKSGFKKVEGFIRGALAAARSIVGSAWGWITGRISGAISAVRNKVSSGFNTVKSKISSAMSRARSIVRNAWNRIRDAAFQGIARLVSMVRELPGKIKSGLGSLLGTLYSAGMDLIRGLINGIGAMAGAVVSKVKGVIGSAKDKAKSLLGINSPSKVFAEYGRNTIQGFINGLDRDQNKLKRGMDRVMGTVAGYNVNAPELAGIANSGAARDLNQLLGAQVDGSLSTEGPVVKQFNYYAAEGSSLGSEEDLFAAAERGRMVGW